MKRLVNIVVEMDRNYRGDPVFAVVAYYKLPSGELTFEAEEFGTIAEARDHADRLEAADSHYEASCEAADGRAAERVRIAGELPAYSDEDEYPF